VHFLSFISIYFNIDAYEANVSPLRAGTKSPQTEDGCFVTTMMEQHYQYERDVMLESAFAWLPTVFEVSDNGQQVTIQDYINGLGPREHFPLLYKLVEQVFRIVMPMLEKTVKHDFEPSFKNDSREFVSDRLVEWDLTDIGRRWEARSKHMTEEAYKELVARQTQEKADEEADRQAAEMKHLEEKAHERTNYYRDDFIPPLQPTITSRWASKKVKVIVKAANYVLQPGQEYSGTWHLEGMPHERIVASAIYYYERDPTIIDAGLYLRRKRDGSDDFPSGEDHHRQVSSIALIDIRTLAAVGARKLILIAIRSSRNFRSASIIQTMSTATAK
jgi:hypothetical protein